MSLSALLLAACHANGSSASAGNDTDSDTDADTDADTDSDTDSDSDTDTTNGSRYFPDDAIWYADVSDAALDVDSETMIDGLQAHGWGAGDCQICLLDT